MNEKGYYNARRAMLRSQTSALSIRNASSLFLELLFVHVHGNNIAVYGLGTLWLP